MKLKKRVHPLPEQCFRISVETLAAMSRDEVDATARDMRECGVFEPPYEVFDLEMPLAVIVAVCSKSADEYYHLMANHPAADESTTLFRYREGKFVESFFRTPGKPPSSLRVIDSELRAKDSQYASKYPDDVADTTNRLFGETMAETFYEALLVLLATRNAEKETKECKAAKLGIGKPGIRHRYTTTIRVGHVTEIVDGDKSSGEATRRRPHLRRGHIRHQHYGPGNKFIKPIFIQPVFVNADDDWVAERTAYNVSV